jgi:hypothetical protein
METCKRAAVQRCYVQRKMWSRIFLQILSEGGCMAEPRPHSGVWVRWCVGAFGWCVGVGDGLCIDLVKFEIGEVEGERAILCNTLPVACCMQCRHNTCHPPQHVFVSSPWGVNQACARARRERKPREFRRPSVLHRPVSPRPPHTCGGAASMLRSLPSMLRACGSEGEGYFFPVDVTIVNADASGSTKTMHFCGRNE